MKNARLNVQGLARRDEQLMRCLPAPAGYTYISRDLSAGEPTVTTQFSGDKNYYDATFGMVGKAPYYAGEVLKIDNLYITVASVSPIGKEKAREWFNSRYKTQSFSELWESNPVYEGNERFQDWFKGQIKQEYALHKMLTLGLGYSMGPRKLVKQAYDSGHVLPFKTAKAFFDAYWTLFGDVARLGKMLEAKFKRDGYLVNPFGFRLVPDKSYKALNYYIQSSVSGIMHMLGAMLAHHAPWEEYITTIHDEDLTLCPDDRLEDSRRVTRLAEYDLNDNLKWRVNMRVGFKAGKDMYDAK